MRYDLSSLFKDTAMRLRALRESQGISPEMLARRLEEQYGVQISHDSLRGYEVTSGPRAGKSEGMRIQTLRMLAHYYGVSTDYLLGLSDDPTRRTRFCDPSAPRTKWHWFLKLEQDHKRGECCSPLTLLDNKRFRSFFQSLLGYCAAVAAMRMIRNIQTEHSKNDYDPTSEEAFKHNEQDLYQRIEDAAMNHPNQSIADGMMAMLQVLRAQSDDWQRGLSKIGFTHHSIVDFEANRVAYEFNSLLEDLRENYDGLDVPNREWAEMQFLSDWKYNLT